MRGVLIEVSRRLLFDVLNQEYAGLISREWFLKRLEFQSFMQMMACHF